MSKDQTKAEPTRALETNRADREGGPDQEPLLVIVQGKRPGERFPLTLERATIGRADKCDLRLDSPVVSSEHARLVRTDEGYSIEDLGSTNGVTVNGRRLQKDELQPLGHGDAITISDHVLLYVGRGSFSDSTGLSTIQVDSDRARAQAEELMAQLDKQGPTAES